MHTYTCPAPSTLNMAVASGVPFVRKLVISVGLRYSEVKRREQDHDHAHYLPQLLRRLQDDSGTVSVKHILK